MVTPDFDLERHERKTLREMSDDCFRNVWTIEDVAHMAIKPGCKYPKYNPGGAKHLCYGDYLKCTAVQSALRSAFYTPLNENNKEQPWQKRNFGHI